jgi:hypothetical protein
MSMTPVPISIRSVLTPIRRQQRKRGRELPREMMNAHERSVDADLFGRDCELDRLAERVAPGVCQPSGWVPGAERQEADLF